MSSLDIEIAPIEVAGRAIGPGEPCFIVAEVAQAHDGSLGAAHAYIDAVARTGAQAIKFQTHIADAESSPAEPFRVRFSFQDKTRYDYWKRMEFRPEEWRGLAAHAADKGLVFLSSPFSVEAVNLLDGIGMPAWKIGSGELGNPLLLDAVAKTKRPVLVSSGMSSWADLDRVVEYLRTKGSPLALFQCTTAYPCPPERVGLNVLDVLRHRYRVPVGLSDHSGTIWPGLGAVALGANLLEVHVVFSKECFGPDTSASVTIDQLAELVEGVHFIERALAPLDKDREAEALLPLKQVFGRSIAAAHDLGVGHVLSDGDLTLKKPATGLPAARLGDLYGRRLVRDISAGTFLRESDVGDIEGR